MAAKRDKRKGKRPASPIALATADYFGNTLVLTEESWLHIQGKQGIRDLGIVQNAVQNPMRIRQSTVEYHTNAIAFETIHAPTSQHLRVLAHYPEDADIKSSGATGQIKTAYWVNTEPSRVGVVLYEASDSKLPDPEKSK